MDKTSIIFGVLFTIGVIIFGLDSELFFLLLGGLIYMGVYFIFGIGYFNKDTIKKQPKALSCSIFYLPGVLVALAFAFIMMVTAEHIEPFPMFLAVAMPPLAHWLSLIFLDYNEKKLKQEQEAKARAFYDECVQFGLTKTKELTPDKRQRMELLAKKHDIPFSSLKDLQKIIARFQPIVEDEQRRAQEAKIRKLKEQEAAEYKTLTLYASLHGRDKPQTIFHDVSQSHYAFARGTSYMPTRKESDGAIMAGMAAGIGGPIPALMSLSSTAQYNEEVRAHNEAVNTMNMLHAQGVAAAMELGAKYHKMELAVATKLVEDGTPEQWMEYLSFENTELKVTETGTVIVTTEMFAKPVTIFGDTPAYLDGSVIANIYDGEKRIGQAIMVFPAYGTNSWVDYCTYAGEAEGFTHRFKSRYLVKYDYCTGVFERVLNNKPNKEAKPSTSLIGMCPFCGKPDKTYTVQFTPGDLWAIEL
ncbi:MAG: hypothetical protein ACOX7F_05910 [Eubacteriales bacterium]